MKNKNIIIGVIAILGLFLAACDADLNGMIVESEMENDVTAQEEVAEEITTESTVEEISDEVEDVSEETAEELIEDSAEDSTEILESETGLRAITRDEIAEHSSSSSCWVGYNGYVYDLTAWLSGHPGGADSIIPNCGTVEQFTDAYNNRHGERSELRRSDAIGVVA